MPSRGCFRAAHGPDCITGSVQITVYSVQIKETLNGATE